MWGTSSISTVPSQTSMATSVKRVSAGSRCHDQGALNPPSPRRRGPIGKPARRPASASRSCAIVSACVLRSVNVSDPTATRKSDAAPPGEVPEQAAIASRAPRPMAAHVRAMS